MLACGTWRPSNFIKPSLSFRAVANWNFDKDSTGEVCLEDGISQEEMT